MLHKAETKKQLSGGRKGKSEAGITQRRLIIKMEAEKMSFKAAFHPKILIL